MPVLDNTELLAADPTLPERPADPKWGLRTTHYKDDGNILDFYRHGDTAPDGRFLYRYFE